MLTPRPSVYAAGRVGPNGTYQVLYEGRWMSRTTARGLRHVTQGLCRHCVKPRAPDSAMYCERHREKHRIRARRLRGSWPRGWKKDVAEVHLEEFGREVLEILSTTRTPEGWVVVVKRTGRGIA